MRGDRRFQARGWRRLLLLWCLLLVCTGMARPAVAAPRLHAYTGTPYFYALSYPSSWQRLRVPGANLAIIAPDRNGVVSVSLTPGSADGSALRRALPRAFAPFGRLVRPPSSAVLRLYGATGWAARGLVRTARGKESSVLAVLVSHHGHLFSILGVVSDLGAHGAESDERTVETIIAGTRFL